MRQKYAASFCMYITGLAVSRLHHLAILLRLGGHPPLPACGFALTLLVRRSGGTHAINVFFLGD